jgi:hypothetical protein
MLSRHPEQVIVLFSAYLDIEIQAKARAIGISACVSKSEASRLPDIITRLLQG